jgi:hypothetical protein
MKCKYCGKTVCNSSAQLIGVGSGGVCQVPQQKMSAEFGFKEEVK